MEKACPLGGRTCFLLFVISVCPVLMVFLYTKTTIVLLSAAVALANVFNRLNPIFSRIDLMYDSQLRVRFSLTIQHKFDRVQGWISNFLTLEILL